MSLISGNDMLNREHCEMVYVVSDFDKRISDRNKYLPIIQNTFITRQLALNQSNLSKINYPV